LFLSLAFWGTPSSVDTFTMAEKSLSAFSHKERTMSPETETISPASQASDQPGDNVSPPTPTPRMHGKLNYRTHHDSFQSEDNLTEGVSFLTNAYKQFANKPIQDCINDGFPSSFLHCQNSQATESSINADVSTSEPGRSYLQATDGLGPVSLPSSYGEYATVQIRVICNYAPDVELDENGNPTLHFQRDAAGNFYNATMRNLFSTMQTLMCCAGFFPDVGMMILLASVVVMNVCMLMGPTSGWSETEEYDYLSQFQLPFVRNIIAYSWQVRNLVGILVIGHNASDNILPWLRMKFSRKVLIHNVFLSHPQNIKWRYTLEHA